MNRRRLALRDVLLKGGPQQTDEDLLPSAAFCRNTMPTVLRVGSYRFYFYAGDGREPPHVHVERDDGEAKIWLEPVRLERSGGFSAVELRRIEKMVTDYHDQLMSSWHDFFSG